MANSIKIWKTVERRIGGHFKFCNSTPLWHNFNFVCGNRPFVQPSWSSLGVNTCGDIYDNQGLCSFQTLRTKFCLPASAYFVFSCVLLSKRMAFREHLLFPLILCGTGLHYLLFGHLFPYYIIQLLIALQNLFLLKLFGIGNYLTLIYLSTGRECGLISA